MSAGVPWHEILPIPRGWLSEKILTARLGEEFSLDSPFHRTPFKYFPRGFGSLRNFAERLREAWRNSLLHEQVLDLLDQLRFQIRFDTS